MGPRNIFAICTSLVTNYLLLLHLYHIFFHHSLTFLACAYIMRVVTIIEINRKPISIFVHQGDLLLSNMFPYMLETEPVPSIWENYFDSFTYFPNLIGNDCLWCNFMHVVEPFPEKPNECIPLLICEQCTTKQNRLLMMIYSCE